jgi:MFS-type transporter involved in bile tolerance (Atg22 family)
MVNEVAPVDAAAVFAKARPVGPYLLGRISDATHSFAEGLLVIAALMVTGGLLLLFVRQDV